MVAASSLSLLLSLAAPSGQTPDPSVTPRASEPEPVARENWQMVVAGDVLIGAGMGGFAVMVAGLAVQSQSSQELDRLSLRAEAGEEERDEVEARRQLGVRLALAGASTTFVLIGTGITLVAVGNRRERRRREALDASAWGLGPSAWVVGARSRRSFGLSWAWRF